MFTKNKSNKEIQVLEYMELLEMGTQLITLGMGPSV